MESPAESPLARPANEPEGLANSGLDHALAEGLDRGAENKVVQAPSTSKIGMDHDCQAKVNITADAKVNLNKPEKEKDCCKDGQGTEQREEMKTARATSEKERV